MNEEKIADRMTTNYLAVQAGLTVPQMMKELITQAAQNDNISTIYVLREDQTLAGAIDLKELIIARADSDPDAILMTSYPYVYTYERIEDCVERLRDYSEDSIPVLDARHRLKGVLTGQTITELVGDALEEDYAKLAGLNAEEDLKEPLLKSLSKRLPWLAVLLILGLLVSGVVGLFEQVVADLALIVAFQSLVLDMAGNAGTQSLAVTIRVLMDEQVDGKQKLALIAKETRVGLINGILFGVASLALVGVYLMLFKGQSAATAFSISLCIGLALMVSMLLSGIIGTTVPILFKQMHIDPAVASGPLITTANDLIAVVIYYGLAWWLLLGVLQL